MYDAAFRERAGRRQAWGFGLLAAAAGIWLWVAAQLVLPFHPGHDDDNDCQSRVFYADEDRRGRQLSYAEAEGESCDRERDPAGLLALVVLSLPFAVTGTVLYTSAATGIRQSEHAAEMARLAEHPHG